MKDPRTLTTTDKKELQKSGLALVVSTLVAGYSLYVAYNNFSKSVSALSKRV